MQVHWHFFFNKVDGPRIYWNKKWEQTNKEQQQNNNKTENKTTTEK